MLKDITKNFFIGLIRTVTPIIAALIITWLTSLGVVLDAETSAQLSLVIFGGIVAVYYMIVSVFERYVSPKFGWLLGVAKTPEYQRELSNYNPALPDETENRAG